MQPKEQLSARWKDVRRTEYRPMDRARVLATSGSEPLFQLLLSEIFDRLFARYHCSNLGSMPTCGGAAGRVTCQAMHWDATGPIRPFTGRADAAAQLHQTGHSCILQHPSRGEGQEGGHSRLLI